MGLRHADRGNARGAARRREGRQGPVHRSLVDARLAVLLGAAHLEATRLDAFRFDADYYNLLYREEEREMLKLCAAEGIAVIPWSPLARGRLARPWSDDPATDRDRTDEVSKVLYERTRE